VSRISLAYGLQNLINEKLLNSKEAEKNEDQNQNLSDEIDFSIDELESL
jgi:hypothetical protein